MSNRRDDHDRPQDAERKTAIHLEFWAIAALSAASLIGGIRTLWGLLAGS